MEVQSILQAATAYASLGWYVLPTLGKVPQCGNDWQNKTTISDIESVFSKCKYDGVGVLLGEKSGIVDIECDDDEAEETLLELLAGELPHTPTFQSTRGKHYIFKWQAGLPNKAVFKIGKLEFRIGNGGACQTVFPPSSGRIWEIEPTEIVANFPAWETVVKRYEENHKPKKFKVISGVSPYYGDGSTLNVPRWLAKHGKDIVGKTDSGDATRWHIECPNIEAHTTNNGWRDCCVTQKPDGTLGGHCLHQSCGMDSWERLRDAIGTLTHEDYHEVNQSLSPIDISNFMVDKPPIESPVEKSMEQSSSEEIKKLTLPFPKECLDVPGIVGEIVEYNLQTALYPRPELALAGALTLMSLITGRKIEDRWELRTNCYFIGLCHSGGGKSHAKQVNSKILGKLGKQEMIMPKPKSGSGLVSSLRDSPASILQIDELADWLEIMKNPQKSPHTYEILGLLKEVYSECTNEIWKPAGYADNKKNPTIDSPHLTMYGVAPVGVFWQALTKQNLTDGLVGRLMVVESFSPNESNDDAERKPPPECLLDKVLSWINFAPGTGNLASMNYKAVKIQHTEEAWRRYTDHRKGTERKQAGESEEAVALWCRTPEKTGKLAMLRACSRICPEHGKLPVVEIDDVEWAIKLSNWITRMMLERSGLYVAENQVEGNLLRVLRICEKWISKRDLSRKTQFLKSKERDELIRDAILTERLEERKVDTGGMIRFEYQRRG